MVDLEGGLPNPNNKLEEQITDSDVLVSHAADIKHELRG